MNALSRAGNQGAPSDTPCVHTRNLNTLWLQVAGTICNLRCTHCFISCSPENDKFGFMPLDMCSRYLKEAQELGVRDYYFTGGEPFANPQMCDILGLTLQCGPTTVLTNATLLRDGVLDRLSQISARSSNPLEFRVSLEGPSAEKNDSIRGKKTFERTMDGTRQLLERGFRPIITITRTWDGDDCAVLAHFARMLDQIGYDAPRLKILPLLKLGAEIERTGPYCSEAHITPAMMSGFDESNFVCSSARLATDRGVWVCPILLDYPEARMGDGLAESVRDYPLSHAVCLTCWQYGALCSNQTCRPNACDANAAAADG